MASNYWESTQRKFWTFTKQQLAFERKRLEESERNLVNLYPLPDLRHLSVYFRSRKYYLPIVYCVLSLCLGLNELSKISRPVHIRQQVFATAQVYIRRFYLKVEIRRTNPALVLATAFYLACKMEECPQHIRMVLAEARHVWDVNFSDISKIGECEFTLISELNSQLIIHHPYRSLQELQTNFQLTAEENSMAWNIINDHYLTDLPLLHAPHVIAITAMFLAVALKPTQGGQLQAANVASALQNVGNARNATGAGNQNRVQKLVDWLGESDVDMQAVVECTQELISLYEVWDACNEKLIKEQIAKFVKARGLDK